MKRYWIGINLVKGIDAVRFRVLLDFFGDAQSAWEASPADLRAAGLSQQIVERFIAAHEQVDLDALWEKTLAKDIHVMTWDDPNYPTSLREISQPPPVLYLRGDFVDEDAWAIANVGTRRVTSYGRQMTEEIASFLAQNGVTVVSGLARGVDGIAHQAALNAGGRTLAVLGSGVDRIYPPEHRNLAEAISGSGAILSDYPPDTPPEASNFPPRNRIISGLSMATMQSKGPNKLIQNGAHSLLQPRDILEVLDLTRVTEQRIARQFLPTDETESSLFDALDFEPTHVDEIRAKTGLDVAKVPSTLVMMEVKGMVRHELCCSA